MAHSGGVDHRCHGLFPRFNPLAHAVYLDRVGEIDRLGGNIGLLPAALYRGSEALALSCAQHQPGTAGGQLFGEGASNAGARPEDPHGLSTPIADRVHGWHYTTPASLGYRWPTEAEMGNLGELAALGTAMCWTITALSFESAGKRVGSLSVNLIRLWIAFGLLTLYSLIFRGVALPIDAGSHAWLWLSLSGLVGFVIGDLFLFQAFVLIGARVSMLVFSAVPPITAFIGWLALGEMLTLTELLGIALTTGGIAAVVGQRQAQEEVTATAGADDVATAHSGVHAEKAASASDAPAAAADEAPAGGAHPAADTPASTPPRRLRGLTLKQSVIGALFALGGALGQAGGLVLSRHGVGDYNPFAATQIRGIAGIIGFSVLFTVLRRWHKVGEALRNGPAMRRISLGAFFGPFLGVSLSLLAVQNTTAGIASTIMALVPVLIIPPAAIIFRERIRVLEIIAALVAVTGVSLLFLT